MPTYKELRALWVLMAMGLIAFAVVAFWSRGLIQSAQVEPICPEGWTLHLASWGGYCELEGTN
jgi:hypothetical protein